MEAELITRKISMGFAAFLFAVTAALLSPAPAAAQSAPSPVDAIARISLNLKDAEAVDVFRLIAEQNNLNILVSKDVKGTLSLRLSNITIQEAFDVILEATHSKMEIAGNIIKITPLGADDGEEPGEGATTVTEIITPTYANSDNVASVLNSYLTANGKITTFAPGNTTNANKRKMLIITETPANIDNLRRLVEKLDTPIPQILIEAKMVETALTDIDMMGVDWSVGASLAGSPVKIDSDYAPGGKIALGTLNLSQLGAVFSALQKDTTLNLLSDVKIAASDGVAADIHVGDSIPVGLNSISSGSGGSSVVGTTGIESFSSGVQLSVVPTVLGDDKIYLEIHPTISTVTGFSTLSAGGSEAPITNTRTASTKIIVKNHDTIVIAGLLKEQDEITVRKFPVLGDLPLVGPAFRRKEKSHDKRNLLVFITAHIMRLDEPPKADKPEDGLDAFMDYK